MKKSKKMVAVVSGITFYSGKPEQRAYYVKAGDFSGLGRKMEGDGFFYLDNIMLTVRGGVMTLMGLTLSAYDNLTKHLTSA